MDPQLGTVLSERWRLDGELGRGGFSVVYDAEDLKLGQRVALKLLVPPPAAAAAALERLRREVKATRALSHPNIVPVYDLVEEGTRAYVVMERVPGRDLSARVTDSGPVSPTDAATLAMEVASALTAAHRRGILHRDVKPANVLLGEDGRARLVDFGSARMEGEASLTRSGGFVGTLDFADPRVLAGERADPRSDVYGLGLTLFFAVTGQLPPRPSPHLPPTPSPTGHEPRTLVPGLPSWLDEIVARATCEDPRSRFPTTLALEEALSRKGSFDGATQALDGLMTLAPFCFLCGVSTQARDGVCRACSQTNTSGTDRLFVRAAPEARAAVQYRLAALLCRPPDLLDDVVAGRRALSAPNPSHDDAATRLVAAGVPVQRLSRVAALGRLPNGLKGLLGAVAVGGAITGALTGTLLGWVGLPLAVVLATLAGREVASPLVTAGPGRHSALPPDLDATVERTLAEIEQPSPRELVLDLAELARAAIRDGDDVELRDDVERLMSTALDAARAMSRIERTLAVVDKHRADAAVSPAIEQAERARGVLQQQLLETLGNLARVQISGRLGERIEHAELARMNESLARELSAREEALRELEQLA